MDVKNILFIKWIIYMDTNLIQILLYLTQTHKKHIKFEYRYAKFSHSGLSRGIPMKPGIWAVGVQNNLWV